MMNNTISCVIDMFDSQAKVIYTDNSTELVPSTGILEYLYETCKCENINKIHLFGNKQYIEGMIQQNPPLDYGCGKIEIEVN